MFTITNGKEHHRLVLRGVLNHDAYSELSRLMATVSLSSYVLLDLTEVAYIGSECIGILLAFGSRVRREGYTMNVKTTNGCVEDVLTVCGVFKLFKAV